MAELSERSGVAIPTIRFYLREGLLAPGRATSPNQAEYHSEHVRSLKLIRTLVEVGGLSLTRVREVLEFIRAKDSELYPVLGGVQYALMEPPAGIDDEAGRAARDQVDRLVADRGWQVRPDNPARVALAHALASLNRLGQDDVAAKLDLYADAAETLARREVPDLLGRDSVEAMAEGVIAYDVLGDALVSALRRLAQESVVTVHLRRTP